MIALLLGVVLNCTALSATAGAGTIAVSCATPVPTPAPTAAPTAKPTIVPTALPTSAPTVKPTPVPTATPAPTGAAVFPNGHYPPRGSVLYAPTSVWNQVLPANPKLLSNSAAIVSAQFQTIDNQSGSEMHGQEAGQYDYSHVAYYASSSDVLIHTACNQYCPTTPVGDILVPAKARPAGGSDAHMISVQPNHHEIDMWACYLQNGGPISRDWQGGDTLTCGNVSDAGDLFTGPGQDAVGPGADAMNSALLAGQIFPAELISGQINHALFVTGQCAVGMQFPAPPGSSTDPCTSGVGPPLGGRMQYTVPCATTKQNTALMPWEVGVLCALNIYGGYMGDDGGGGTNFTGLGVGIGGENAEAGFQFGLISPTGIGDDLVAMAPQGWTNSLTIPNTLTSVRWYSNHIDNNGHWLPPGVTFKNHIVWLDPCVTQKTC